MGPSDCGTLGCGLMGVWNHETVESWDCGIMGTLGPWNHATKKVLEHGTVGICDFGTIEPFQQLIIEPL